jgi:hypothetical protein
MKTTVFIPTTPNHIKYVPKIIDTYLAGTCLPDEIIVSISMAHMIGKETKDILVQKGAKILEHNSQMLIGPNKQWSKEHSEGDIILYNDSDDFPHRQRIEIVKKIFEKYDILHMTHSYKRVPHDMDFDINFDDIKIVESDTLHNLYFPNGDFKECTKITQAYGGGAMMTHAGVPCIRKELLDTIIWKHPSKYLLGICEDYEFCMETLFKHKKSITIDAELYLYEARKWVSPS